MLATIGRLLPGVLAAALLAGPALGDEPSSQISLVGRFETGDRGSGTGADGQALVLRYVRGDRTRLRLELPMLRIERDAAVIRTIGGTVPTRDRRRQPSDAAAGPGASAGPSPTSPPVFAAAESIARADPWVVGVGDLTIGVSRRVAGGGSRLHRLDASVEVKVPTADEDEGLGTGEWDGRLALTGERRFWGVTAFGGAGWSRLGEPDWVALSDGFDGYVGVETEPTASGLVVTTWVDAAEPVGVGVGARSRVAVGLRTTRRTGWHVMVLRGLSAAAEDYGVMAGVTFGTRSGARSGPEDWR